jgi:hypothetical protein
VGDRRWSPRILAALALIAAVSILPFADAIAGPAREPRLVHAPTFVAGPRITPSGLIWLSASAERFVSTTGVSRALSRPAGFSVSSPDSRWVAQIAHGQVLTGILGGPLKRDMLMRRCLPLRPMSDSSPLAKSTRLLAISGAQLYAAVDPRCLHRRSYGRAAVLVENLMTHSSSLLIPIPTGALDLSVAGERLAITLSARSATPERSPGTVEVYDTHARRRLFQLDVPSTPGNVTSLLTHVDDLGDVLITAMDHRPIPSGPASSGWWATPRSARAHSLPPLITTSQALPGWSVADQTPRPAAAISHGRIAYAVGSQYNGERIAVLDLSNRRTRNAVHFQADTAILGLDLAIDRLAWAQQSSVPEERRGTTADGGQFLVCSARPLGQPALEVAKLNALPKDGLSVGKRLPVGDHRCNAMRR